MAEINCKEHGPYDAALGACPICHPRGSGRQRMAPSPLSDDDMETNLGGGGYSPRAGRGNMSDDDMPTEIPGARRKGGSSRDSEEDEPTEILDRFGSGGDETVLEFEKFDFMGMLWVKEGNRRGSTYKIKEGTLIGRKSGSLIIDDLKVSDPHAKFTVENDAFVLWDCGSKNGTFVNGERIRAATPLKENDTIKIGDTVFTLKLLS